MKQIWFRRVRPANMGMWAHRGRERPMHVCKLGHQLLIYWLVQISWSQEFGYYIINTLDYVMYVYVMFRLLFTNFCTCVLPCERIIVNKNNILNAMPNLPNKSFKLCTRCFVMSCLRRLSNGKFYQYPSRWRHWRWVISESSCEAREKTVEHG